ncbi:hypothetical protein BGZ59_004179, partial [Podila verticillata]
VPNPEYKEDPDMVHYKIGGVGLDLWQVNSGSIFDDIVVTNEIGVADKYLEQWKEMSAKEGVIVARMDEEAKAKENEEAKEKENAKEVSADELEMDELDEDDEEEAKAKEAKEAKKAKKANDAKETKEPEKKRIRWLSFCRQ